jgi:signal transduction histidine kinase
VSLGLPVHLVPHHVSRASAKAAHIVALVGILSAMFAVISMQSQRPDLILWPALVAFSIVLTGLWQVDRHRTALYSVAYIVVGGMCVYWISVVAMLQFPGLGVSDIFVLSMAKIALIMVGGPGVRAASAIAWSAAGGLVAGAATFLAAHHTGSVFVIDGTAVAAFLIFATLQLGLALTRGRGRIRTAQPNLHRAARDEQLSAMRYRIEVKAAAVMHDTVLNHLAAIANANDGEIQQTLRDQIDRDLEVLVGEEWLLDVDGAPDQQTHVEWRTSPLFKVVEESRQLGLEVDVSGDVAAVSRLGVERATAVALATKQCLVNVQRHAGTDRAELVVYGSDREVSVMVIDTGRGFSEQETGSDRLGLRHSVRRRIENVGGSVQVWSTPGKGTSVMIRVPAVERAEVQPG